MVKNARARRPDAGMGVWAVGVWAFFSRCIFCSLVFVSGRSVVWYGSKYLMCFGGHLSAILGVRMLSC